jgi:hypothetical protein
MIFPQHNYKEYHNDNTQLHPVQPYSRSNWADMVNDSYKYCSTWNIRKEFWFVWFRFIGRFKVSNLPSFHPHWDKEIKKDRNRKVIELEKKLELCISDNSLYKVYFSITANEQIVRNMIDKYK